MEDRKADHERMKAVEIDSLDSINSDSARFFREKSNRRATEKTLKNKLLSRIELVEKA